MTRHVEDTIDIMNEVTIPNPQSDQCDMLILWEALAELHLGTAIFKRGVECKQNRLVASAAWEAFGTEFRVQDHVLERAYTFN